MHLVEDDKLYTCVSTVLFSNKYCLSEVAYGYYYHPLAIGAKSTWSCLDWDTWILRGSVSSVLHRFCYTKIWR